MQKAVQQLVKDNKENWDEWSAEWSALYRRENLLQELFLAEAVTVTWIHSFTRWSFPTYVKRSSQQLITRSNLISALDMSVPQYKTLSVIKTDVNGLKYKDYTNKLVPRKPLVQDEQLLRQPGMNRKPVMQSYYECYFCSHSFFSVIFL